MGLLRNCTSKTTAACNVCCMQSCVVQKFAKVLDLVCEVTIDGTFEKLYMRDHERSVFHVIVCCAEIRKSTSSTI